VVDQALTVGHDVIAVTRRPDSFGPRRPRLSVVGADLQEPIQVTTALTGADAVISAAGVNPSRRQVTMYSVGARNILDAMSTAGVRRIVCVSSKELDEGGVQDEPVLYRFVFARLLGLVNRTIYDDMRRMELTLRESDAAWTVVRPAGLFAADHVTGYRVATGHEPGVSTSVADLADALVREVSTTDQHIGQVVTVLTDEGTPPYLRLLAGQRTLHQR